MRSNKRSRMMDAKAADVWSAWCRATRYGRTTSPARGMTSPVAKPTFVIENRRISGT
jgi:hypothetical protein